MSKKSRTFASRNAKSGYMSSRAFIYQLSKLGKSILPKGAHLWLYGSRARGDSHNDSDWDLLILLDKEKQELSDFDNYSYPFIYKGALADQVVSAHIYTNKEWEGMSFLPFYKNVEQDKIVLV